MSAPAPLTPSGCDLRDFPYIPLHIDRLKRSRAWLLCKRNPALAFHLFNTWTAAYHSVPAGSLENDDMMLADIAMCDDTTWAKIKDDVLRGWVLADDGRWYNPTVSEQALEAWLQKIAQRKATAAATAKRSNIAFDPKPFEDLSAEAIAHLRRLNPNSRLILKRGALPVAPQAEPAPRAPVGAAAEAPDEHPDGEASGEPDGCPDGSPHDAPSGPPPGGPGGPPREGIGKGIEILSPSLRSGDARAGASPADVAEEPPRRPPKTSRMPTADFETWYEGYPHKVGRGAAEKAFARVMAVGDVTLDELVAARDRYIRSKNPEHAWCNPATWLNQRRWLDKPATSLSPPAASPSSPNDPRVDLGGGIQAPYSTIRGVWSKGRWLDDWGPRPDQPGCRIPPQTMAAIMGANAA